MKISMMNLIIMKILIILNILIPKKKKDFNKHFHLSSFCNNRYFYLFLRSPLLYKYYYNSALKSSSVTEKLSYYNSALRYSKNDDLLNSIYTTLKSDSDFVDNSSILTNLNTSEKKII